MLDIGLVEYFWLCVWQLSRRIVPLWTFTIEAHIINLIVIDPSLVAHNFTKFQTVNELFSCNTCKIWILFDTWRIDRHLNWYSHFHSSHGVFADWLLLKNSSIMSLFSSWVSYNLLILITSQIIHETRQTCAVSNYYIIL